MRDKEIKAFNKLDFVDNKPQKIICSEISMSDGFNEQRAVLGAKTLIKKCNDYTNKFYSDLKNDLCKAITEENQFKAIKDCLIAFVSKNSSEFELFDILDLFKSFGLELCIEDYKGNMKKFERRENKKIIESDIYNLSNRKDVEKAKDELEKHEETEVIEPVIDQNAETEDELKKSYVGDVVLECPTCHTLIYKSKDELVQDETNEELYNVDDDCPTCHANSGFYLLGDVKSVESAKKEENKQSKETKSNNNKLEKLLKDYLKRTYDNVEDYNITNCKESVNNCEYCVEGIIKFKSGKSLKNSFVFTENCDTKRGKKRLIGYNEKLSSYKKAYCLTCNKEDSIHNPESLIYNYSVLDENKEKKIVYGRVIL